MCLILFAHDVHPEFALVLAANRDEFHDRPTAPAGAWPDRPDILAGRDLRSGGTWLGVTSGGRWAAVTNVREGTEQRPDSVSRGHLVADFLESAADPMGYAEALAARMDEYNGFNLLVGLGEDAVWLSNRLRPTSNDGARPVRLTAGIYGVSNHLLDTPWPKVTRGKLELERLLQPGKELTTDGLLSLLLDRAYAADHQLPDTGVPRDLERALSSAFITTPDYGTRSSSALLIRRNGRVNFAERRFDAAGAAIGEDRFEIAPFIEARRSDRSPGKV